jgi:hypothetical protein
MPNERGIYQDPVSKQLQGEKERKKKKIQDTKYKIQNKNVETVVAPAEMATAGSEINNMLG